ncbi:MAG: hypothetical protein M1828_000953 [Chrysothrix sp. TS-e1954]|nr:MAG: hypothetical protein M1828_000953 [Chrysothrix sp. TS-e1954]
MIATLLFVLFCTVTRAVPYMRPAAIQQLSRRTLPLNHHVIKARPQIFSHKGASQEEQITYTGNWAGAILTTPPTNETYVSASGQITLPIPTRPSFPPGKTVYSASAWVGIDGDTDLNLILQGGVTISLEPNGTVVYQAWAEWWPGPIHYFTNFSGSAGDVVSVEVTGITNSTGTVKLANMNTGQSMSHNLSAPSADTVLVGQNAEWIVEDWLQDGLEVPLVDFGTVNFTKCVGKTATQSVGLEKALAINIANAGNLYTDVEILSDSALSVEYLQPEESPLPKEASELVSNGPPTPAGSE